MGGEDTAEWATGGIGGGVLAKEEVITA